MINNNSFDSIKASVKILENLNARFNQNLSKNFSRTWCYDKAGLDRSCMCICGILEITNFTDWVTWLFFTKDTLKHTFSDSWVSEATLRNKMYIHFKTICMSDS